MQMPGSESEDWPRETLVTSSSSGNQNLHSLVWQLEWAEPKYPQGHLEVASSSPCHLLPVPLVLYFQLLLPAEQSLKHSAPGYYPSPCLPRTLHWLLFIPTGQQPGWKARTSIAQERKDNAT